MTATRPENVNAGSGSVATSDLACTISEPSKLCPSDAPSAVKNPFLPPQGAIPKSGDHGTIIGCFSENSLHHLIAQPSERFPLNR